MSEFNEYAQQLNTAFLNAKAQCDQALAAFKEAEKATKEDAQLTPKEAFQGDRKARIAEHEAAYQLARQNMNTVLRNAWLEFYRTRSSLTSALQSAIGQEQAANPDDVDVNGMYLLNSGMPLTSYDLQSMAEKYQGNATMLRLIANKADELAQKPGVTADERKAYIIINANCKSNAMGPDVMRRWDLLVRASSIYSNEGDQTDPGYVSQISNHWNDQNIQDSIKSF